MDWLVASTRVCASLALATGVWAARCWFVSTMRAGPSNQLVENFASNPDGPTEKERWFNQTSRDNRSAALWTAASVIFSALSSILGTL